MRRKDREITDRSGLEKIFKSCQVCRLGLIDGDQPYVVPLNFGYDWQGEKPIIYLHCATEGYKLDLIAQNAKVCIEMDCDHEIEAGPMACDYNFNYASIIGFGQAVLLKSYAEKRQGLECLMQHIAGPGPHHFPDNLDQIAVLRVELTSFSGKRRVGMNSR